MEHLLGMAALLFVAATALYLALRYPQIRIVLLAALLVRAGASIFNVYVAPLPDSQADATTFELRAWDWSQGGFIAALGHFTGPDSYFISWILSLVYAITDRSQILAQSVSTLFGMGTVVLGWFLARDLWGERAARKAAWVLALFPTLILYSALTMREAYIWFFLLLGLIGVARWARHGGVWPATGAIVAFIGATFFHGALIIAVLAFLLLVLFRGVYRLLALLPRRIPVYSVSAVVIAALAFCVYAATDISLPKVGTFEQMLEVERVLERAHDSTRDSAAYPEWTVPQSPIELLYKGPVRITYFMFSPFPWDVDSAFHLIGLFDGILYIAIALLLWRNRKLIKEDPGTRSIVFILTILILAFGIAIGNFGTGLRHRAKFVAALIALAAPRLPRIVWGMKQRRSLASTADRYYDQEMRVNPHL